MYIYQNGKLYVRHGVGLVGVDINSNLATRIVGTETDICTSAKFLTPYEVQCKFNGNYVFPKKVILSIPIEPIEEIPLEVKVEESVTEIVKKVEVKAVKKTSVKPKAKASTKEAKEKKKNESVEHTKGTTAKRK